MEVLQLGVGMRRKVILLGAEGGRVIYAPARCARARRSRSRRLIWRVKCVGLTDGHTGSCSGGKANALSRPLSFLSENVKGEEASKRTKRRRKEKREKALSVSLSLSLSRWARCFRLCRAIAMITDPSASLANTRLSLSVTDYPRRKQPAIEVHCT